jgi:hypothetical protein
MYTIRVCIVPALWRTFVGVNEQLKQLLATLHEDNTPKGHSNDFGLTRSLTGSLSATAVEFVPGRPFSFTSSSVPSPLVVPDIPDSLVRTFTSDSAAGVGSFNVDAPEFVPSWAKDSPAAAPSPSPSVLPSPASNVRVIDKKIWWYRDPNNIVRGPFSTTEMRAWSDKGYFNGGLEIALSDRGPFLPLSSVYPAPERPFWKSIEPREFAMRMKQYLMTARGGNPAA